jgi:acetyl-CoA carboxylase carboxyltransferase component
VVRKAFGVAGAANTKPGSTHFRFSWPSGDWGSLPIEGGIEVAYRAELAGVEDPAGEIEKIKERLNRYRSPFRSTDVFEVEEVIDPRDTRPLLCRWANLVAPARQAGTVSFTYRP